MRKILGASLGILSTIVIVGLLSGRAGAEEKSAPAAAHPKTAAKSKTRAPAAKSAGVVMPAGEIKWADSPAMAGAKIAILWGNPKTGAYASLKSLPGGGTLASHTHTHNSNVVLISGTIMFSMNGGPEKELTPGSYLLIPGGTVHSATCKAGADCTYFEEQPGSADIKFVEAAAQK